MSIFLKCDSKSRIRLRRPKNPLFRVLVRLVLSICFLEMLVFRFQELSNLFCFRSSQRIFWPFGVQLVYKRVSLFFVLFRRLRIDLLCILSIKKRLFHVRISIIKETVIKKNSRDNFRRKNQSQTTPWSMDNKSAFQIKLYHLHRNCSSYLFIAIFCKYAKPIPTTKLAKNAGLPNLKKLPPTSVAPPTILPTPKLPLLPNFSFPAI